MQQVGVCAGSGQASDKTIFKHIGAAAGVFADNNTGRLAVAVALAEHIIIPAKEAANLVGVVGSQIDTSFTTEAVCSRVFPNYLFSPLIAKA